MKNLTIVLLVLCSIELASCDHTASKRVDAPNQPRVALEIPKENEARVSPAEAKSQTMLASFNPEAAAADRKIIKTAELVLEVAAPSSTQQQISSIASTFGGFVVTSEMKQLEAVDASKPTVEVNLAVRVPSAQFDAALTQIRNTAMRVIQEKIKGDDVTEEFIDLEARLKAQKALEQQFLSIMKQAGKVEDALEVQRQIAEVRSEIEKLEGHKRFLETRASLSSINITLRTPVAVVVVSTSSFTRSVKEAAANGVEFSTELLLALIRLAIFMIPITLFILLPIALVVRYAVRRARRLQLARQLESIPAVE